MTRDRASDLTILLGRMSQSAENFGLLQPWIWHCPKCYGPVREVGTDWQCGLGLGHPPGCGWRGEPEFFSPKDAFSRSREAIDFLLAEIERAEGDR